MFSKQVSRFRADKSAVYRQEETLPDYLVGSYVRHNKNLTGRPSLLRAPDFFQLEWFYPDSYLCKHFYSLCKRESEKDSGKF